MYRIYATGIIEGGDEDGMYIKIEPSPYEAESFFIFKCKNARFEDEVFDEWIENNSSLEKYFADPDFKVTWLEDTGDKSRTLFKKM